MWTLYPRPPFALDGDVGGKETLEPCEIPGLRRGNECIEKASVLGVAHLASRPIRDVLAVTRDELMRLGHSDPKHRGGR
jgi:hypothetical protein